MKRLTMLLLAALIAAPLAPALAQQDKLPREGEAPSIPINPNATPPQQGDEGPGEGSSLSDRLSHSRGVVQPPPTGDKGVLAPPPAGAASTPVIRPPGSDRNDGPVQPK